jgi:hypothetical protein
MWPPPEIGLPAVTSGADKMNLDEVVALATSKISDELIINQIRTTRAVFHLGA